MASTSKTDGRLALIGNIPPQIHSKDLRRFFSTFVESNRFLCFHFRHRPENLPSIDSSKSKSISFCCLVEIAGGVNDRKEFIRIYNNKNWIDHQGDLVFGRRCRIVSAKLALDEPLPVELKPPRSTMPRGNVGTPTQYFLDSIRQCRLQPWIIKKLGLEFPKSSGRRIYSKVPPPDFERKGMEKNEDDEEDEDKDDEEGEKEKIAEDGSKTGEAKFDEDEEAEEWDRHEAQYDDVTDQDRNKERLYEEDMEVVWEKGGPGLVWYTDAYHWDQQEPDIDAKWADDWDVDTNVYVDPNDADKDARDSVAIRRETMLRSGQLKDESVFLKKTVGDRKRKRDHFRNEGSDVYDHAKSFGRKVMEKHGWTLGTGLGSTIAGKVDPVHDELKEISRSGTTDKRGLGYFGEKIDRRNFAKGKNRSEAEHLITTVYDNPQTTDPPETLLKRKELTWNKRR